MINPNDNSSPHSQAAASYQHWSASARSNPADATAQFNHGWWASRVGRFREAIAAYERALEVGIDGPEEACSNIASIYSEHLGLPTQALEWLHKALVLNPDYFPAVFNRAHLAEQMGDREAALSGFARAMALKPEDPLPLARLAEALEPLRVDDPRLEQIRQHAGSGDADVLMALAKLEERIGRYDAAWEAMQRANSLDAQRLPAWPIDALRERLMRAQSQGMPPLQAEAGPVFIVGMFRTGSTLLEQIFAAHEAFTPLGETDFWPRAVAATGGRMVIPGQIPRPSVLPSMAQAFDQHLRDRDVDPQKRVTDKRPDNLYHLPLIAHALPNARFIITERDWRDTLLSVYGTRLHPQHGYACRLPDIRSQLQLCAELANQWQQQCPERVRVLRYEELVAAPEETLKPLFEWLGEAWDPSCLEFHRLENAVRTASVWQVREPLHGSRRGRWRRYESQLRAVFGPDLDRSII